MNTNQLRIHLDLDYKTVKHHISVLTDNDLITSMGDGYGRLYFVSQTLEQNMEEFMEVWAGIRDKLKEKQP